MDKLYRVLESDENLSELIRIKNQIFVEGWFPDNVFKHRSWTLYFLESWCIFDSVTYDHFIQFAKSLGESNIILAPDDLSDMTISKPVEFNISLPVEAYTTDIQEKYHYYFAVDSFLFTKKANWAFYNLPMLDLMILGFSSEVAESARKYYEDFPDRIHAFSKLEEMVRLWAKKEKVEEVVNKVKLNYGHTFSK